MKKTEKNFHALFAKQNSKENIVCKNTFKRNIRNKPKSCSVLSNSFPFSTKKFIFHTVSLWSYSVCGSSKAHQKPKPNISFTPSLSLRNISFLSENWTDKEVPVQSKSSLCIYFLQEWHMKSFVRDCNCRCCLHLWLDSALIKNEACIPKLSKIWHFVTALYYSSSATKTRAFS